MYEETQRLSDFWYEDFGDAFFGTFSREEGGSVRMSIAFVHYAKKGNDFGYSRSSKSPVPHPEESAGSPSVAALYVCLLKGHR